MLFRGNKILLAVVVGIFLASSARAAVELGIDVLESNGYALLKGKRVGLKCYGCTSVESQFARGNGPAAIVAGWADDVVRFKGERSQYLLY